MERLIKTGKVKPKHSSEIKTSKFGIGFEKLDRDVFNPEKAYDKLAAIGVKWVRIQSGWQRTEQQKGVYDFKWLDKVVDNLIARGCKPWLCLCYGNGLYDEAAAKVFGAVGCPPTAQESTLMKSGMSLTANGAGSMDRAALNSESFLPVQQDISKP